MQTPAASTAVSTAERVRNPWHPSSFCCTCNGRDMPVVLCLNSHCRIQSPVISNRHHSSSSTRLLVVAGDVVVAAMSAVGGGVGGDSCGDGGGGGGAGRGGGGCCCRKCLMVVDQMWWCSVRCAAAAAGLISPHSETLASSMGQELDVAAERISPHSGCRSQRVAGPRT